MQKTCCMLNRIFFTTFVFKIKEKSMLEDKSKIIPYTMQYGLILGVFWMLKYAMRMGFETFPVLAVISSLLSIITPLFILFFLIKYRQETVEGTISFWHGMQFVIMLCFFASLLEMIMIIIHTQWIDPEFLLRLWADMHEKLKSIQMENTPWAREGLKKVPSPFQYGFTTMMQNILLGILMAVVLVPVSQYLNIKNFSNKDN